MDNVVRKTKTVDNLATIRGDQKGDQDGDPIAIPQDHEIEYMAFEEFQKLL